MRIVATVLGVLVLVAAAACKAIQSGPLESPGDAGALARDAAFIDAATDAASISVADAARDAAPSGLCGRAPNTLPKLAQMNLGLGEPCVHNGECQTGSYCNDPSFVCARGAPGKGLNGVAPCTTGNECSSSICGENDQGGYSCSDACDCDDDCNGNMPRCMTIPALGMNMCARAGQQ